MQFPVYLLLLTLFTAAPAARSQASDSSDPQFRVHRSVEDAKRDAKREEAMNKDRAVRIKRDTDKLLELATELKKYVDKTNANVLSLDVIKKSEEIEKLAKSIRERMKQDYRIPDTIQP